MWIIILKSAFKQTFGSTNFVKRQNKEILGMPNRIQDNIFGYHLFCPISHSLILMPIFGNAVTMSPLFMGIALLSQSVDLTHISRN